MRVDGWSGVLSLAVSAELPASALPGRRVIVLGDGPRSWIVIGAYGSSMRNIPLGLVQLGADGAISIAQLPGFDANGHRESVPDGTPIISGGTGAGAGPALSITGTDECGTFLVTTGAAPAANAVIVTLNFDMVWDAVPRSILVTPANAPAAALGGAQPFVPFAGANAPTVSSWRLQSQGGAALAAGANYRWWYHVMR